MKRLTTIILCVFLCNLMIKSFLISSIPSLLTDDESYYATEAQSILASGSDVSGTWRPWQLRPANPIYAELTGLTYAPGFILFPHNTQVAMKVVPIIFGSLLPVLLGLIAYKLFRRKLYFGVTALVATLNPWIFQFSRMSFDSFTSVFFYCLGIVGLLYLKGWKSLVVLIPFALGFFQYQGHKPLLVPLIFVTLLYVIFTEHHETTIRSLLKSTRSYIPQLSVLCLSLLLVAGYALRLSKLPTTRIGEVTIDRTALSAQVNTERRLSFSSPLSSLFVNKFTALLGVLAHRISGTFDTNWLFFRGNAHVDTFAVNAFGFLYSIDALFILVGLVALWSSKNWRTQAIFLTVFALIGALPSVMKNDEIWLTFRAAFLIIGLVLLASVGVARLWDMHRRTFRIALIALYMIFSAPFFYHYFYSYPILVGKNFSLYNRIVASYVKRSSQTPIHIFAGKTMFDSVIAYNGLITKASLPALHTAYTTQHYAIGDIDLASGCFDAQWAATQSAKFIVEYKTGICPTGTNTATPSAVSKPIAVGALTDSLNVFTIYNDTLCQQYDLSSYVSLKKNSLSVESLSDKDFCETFFVDPHKQPTI